MTRRFFSCASRLALVCAMSTTVGAKPRLPASFAAVIRFGLTSTGRKLARLSPQRTEIDRQWANRELSAEAMARMEKEVPEALLAFMAAEDRKRAAK